MAIALGRHDGNGGVWSNTLFLTIANNVNSWADIANDFHASKAELRKSFDTEFYNGTV